MTIKNLIYSLALVVILLLLVRPAEADSIQFGQKNTIECRNCTPFSARVSLRHYDPAEGRWNCWEWDQAKQYCLSPTLIGVPWEAAWGWGAACPVEWPIGTWVSIDQVGSFVCLDRGGLITCDHKTGVCLVDILGPGGAWDGYTYDAILWVPRSVLLRRAK